GKTVTLINIFPELALAVRCGPGGNIYPIYRNWGGELDILPQAIADHLIDMRAIPARRVFEQPGHIVANILDPDAARRNETIVIAKNALFWGVMHIDTIGIVDIDPHHAK